MCFKSCNAILLSCILAFFTSSALAEDSSDDVKNDPLSSFGFGYGIALFAYDDPYIERASLNGEDRIVVIEKSRDIMPGLWLESHWLKDRSALKKDWTWGAFVATKLFDADSKTFDSFALGMLIALGTSNSAEGSLSVGLGWATSTQRRFAKGINEGEALPAQYDEIKYEESAEKGWVVMVMTEF